MFTGIIETVGAVVASSGGRLVVTPKKPLAGLAVGESVSVNGACLTVDRNGRQITFRLLPETLRATALGSLKRGDSVNLERALRLGSRLGGHLMLGHVDGKGTVRSRLRRQGTVTLEIEVPSALAQLLVPKGPIGIDGVSLTLDPALRGNRIRVHLVAHTLRVTTLSDKLPGARVNVEADLIAKYLHQML